MSFTLVAKVMSLKVGSLPRKMVLLKLADQANDDGLCWPSYQTIAESCELSRRSVIRHIQQLETDGYLTITKTYDKSNKKNFSNRYTLTLNRGDRLSLVTDEAPSGDSVSLPSDSVSPEPINEPINESITKDIGEKKKKVAVSKFVEPTLEQVKAYFTERGHQDAVSESEKWIDYYIANGWKVGKNPMKDWKAAIRNWMRNYQPQPQQTNYQGNNHEINQSANSQPKQSSADVYAAKLAEQRRQREAANTTVTGSDRANVYDMEETF